MGVICQFSPGGYGGERTMWVWKKGHLAVWRKPIGVSYLMSDMSQKSQLNFLHQTKQKDNFSK